MRVLDTRLMIGGPGDGRRIAIDPGTNVYMHEERVAASVLDPQPADGRMKLPRTLYRRESISGVTVEFQLWVADGLDPAEVVGRLIANYPDPTAGDLTRTVDFSKVELPEAFR